MKIRRNSPDLLIVEDRPWLIGILIILFILVFVGAGLFLVIDGEWLGLPFALIGGGLGLGAFWAFVRRVQVVFHRPEGWIEIRRANVFRRLKNRYDLDGVERAVVQTSRSDNSDVYRVALIIEAGGVTGTKPLTLAYSNIGDHRGIADTINAWLAEAKTG